MISSRTYRKSTTVKNHQYDDWVCLMCQNLNYSFRKTCNRCRIQTKQSNHYFIEFYNASAYLTLNFYNQQNKLNEKHPQNPTSAYGEHSFPKYLFLELSGDQEDEASQLRRELPEQETPRWINCLIGE